MDDIPGLRSVQLSDEQRALIIDSRNALGLTQKELGAKIGRPAITIYSIETGKYLPSQAMLADLCATLALTCDVTVDVHLCNGARNEKSRLKISLGDAGKRTKAKSPKGNNFKNSSAKARK